MHIIKITILLAILSINANSKSLLSIIKGIDASGEAYIQSDIYNQESNEKNISQTNSKDILSMIIKMDARTNNNFSLHSILGFQNFQNNYGISDEEITSSAIDKEPKINVKSMYAKFTGDGLIVGFGKKKIPGPFTNQKDNFKTGNGVAILFAPKKNIMLVSSLFLSTNFARIRPMFTAGVIGNEGGLKYDIYYTNIFDKDEEPKYKTEQNIELTSGQIIDETGAINGFAQTSIHANINFSGTIVDARYSFCELEDRDILDHKEASLFKIGTRVKIKGFNLLAIYANTGSSNQIVTDMLKSRQTEYENPLSFDGDRETKTNLWLEQISIAKLSKAEALMLGLDVDLDQKTVLYVKALVATHEDELKDDLSAELFISTTHKITKGLQASINLSLYQHKNNEDENQSQTTNGQYMQLELNYKF